MIHLKNISGLPLILKKEGTILFPHSIRHQTLQKRLYKGYEKFFAPIRKGKKLDFLKPLYYIYRNVRYPAHETLFKKQGIRFDITVLQSGTLDNQAIRTIGHIHKKIAKNNRGRRIRPEELYQVLHGTALFYLEHENRKRTRILRVHAGATVRIPGAWGHSIINASRKKPLVTANIFTRKKDASDYSFFKKTNGPLLYPIWKGNNIVFIKTATNTPHHPYIKTIQKKTRPLYPF